MRMQFTVFRTTVVFLSLGFVAPQLLTPTSPQPSLSSRRSSAGLNTGSPCQSLQRDPGVNRFSLAPLTTARLLTCSPVADLAEPRLPRHTNLYYLFYRSMVRNDLKSGSVHFWPITPKPSSLL